MDVRRFALKIKLTSRMNRISIDAVQACGMMLRDGLRMKGNIVQGYCVSDSGETFKHYWVEDTDLNIHDIGMELAKITNPDLGDMTYKLTKIKPHTPSDISSDEHNEELFKLYLEEPKKFWKLIQKTR